MYKEKEVFLLQTLTPLHAGGSFEFSVVDQPIQREGHTGFPKIEASSLKGSLRHHFVRGSSQNRKDEIESLFGTVDAESASAIALSDARLLFFPVRSAKGIFAYVTSPYIIHRFQQEAALFSSDKDWKPVEFDSLPIVCQESKIVIETNQGENLLLEEYRYKNVRENESFNSFILKLANKFGLESDMLQEHAVLVSDDEFSYYAQHSTEITTRISIDIETGTSKEGALFHEEYVPADAIFYSVLFATHRNGKEASHWMGRMQNLLPNVFQVGGNVTLGKGVLQLFRKQVAE